MRHIAVQDAFSARFEDNQCADGEIDDLLGQLQDLSTRICGALRQTDPSNADDPRLYRLAADILRLRRQRNRLLGSDLFGEPAWDMLLELYAAQGSGRRLSVSGACYVSGVPSSTALRWIGRLEKDGWIRRVGDPRDKRRSWLALCDEAEKKIHRYLSLMGAPPS